MSEDCIMIVRNQKVTDTDREWEVFISASCNHLKIRCLNFKYLSSQTGRNRHFKSAVYAKKKDVWGNYTFNLDISVTPQHTALHKNLRLAYF